MPVLVPGLFSQPARATEQHLGELRKLCNVTIGEDGVEEGGATEPAHKSAASIGSGGGRKDDSAEKGDSQRGSLARAIQDRVKQNLDTIAATREAGANNGAAKAAAVTGGVAFAPIPHRKGLGGASMAKDARQDLKDACFASLGNKRCGQEAWWTTRFGAGHDSGAINKRGELKPDPGWYTSSALLSQHAIKDRNPSWEIGPGARPSSAGRAPRAHSAEPRPGNTIKCEDRGTLKVTFGETATSFLTGIDVENGRASPKRERAHSPIEDSEKIETRGEMARASKRPELRKVGRAPFHGNEVSAPAEDVLQQDIKGYHKLRLPEWDFASISKRPVVKGSADKAQDPGRYDIDFNARSLNAPVKSGLTMENQLGREVCVRNLGYSAPPRVLHPDEETTQLTSATKRNPVPDRSHAKDSVRRRATHVNDMARELERPPPQAASREYHDSSNPAIDKEVMQRALKFDVVAADMVVRARVLGPDYSRMLPRGRDAVQGLRALSSDLSVRGSVGIGFTETTGQREKEVKELEARSCVGGRPDVGPRFMMDTRYAKLQVKNNYNHGHPPVESLVSNKAVSTLQKMGSDFSGFKFKRESKIQAQPSSCTSTKHRSLGAHSVLARSRTHEALSDWTKVSKTTV